MDGSGWALVSWILDQDRAFPRISSFSWFFKVFQSFSMLNFGRVRAFKTDTSPLSEVNFVPSGRPGFWTKTEPSPGFQVFHGSSRFFRVFHCLISGGSGPLKRTPRPHPKSISSRRGVRGRPGASGGVRGRPEASGGVRGACPGGAPGRPGTWSGTASGGAPRTPPDTPGRRGFREVCLQQP